MSNMNIEESRMNLFLRKRDEEIITKRDYHKAFINNPGYFLKNGNAMNHFKAYLVSPSKVDNKRKMLIFLHLDILIQSIRLSIKWISTENPYILATIGAVITYLSDLSIGHRGCIYLALTISIGLNLFRNLFYIIDHIISILSTFLASLNGASEFLSKAYLNILKVKSEKLDFVFFDKGLNSEDRKYYEQWILEILNLVPILNNLYFNILITKEKSNVLNESRKMVAIYDSPYQKIYDNPTLLGLYSPAGATIICKSISRDYLLNTLELHSKDNFSNEMENYNNDILKFKKQTLYHEIAHMIISSIDNRVLMNEEAYNIYNEEKNILHPTENSYFCESLDEYLAENIARYIVEGRVGDLNIEIDYRSTRTYELIENYMVNLKTL